MSGYTTYSAPSRSPWASTGRLVLHALRDQAGSWTPSGATTLPLGSGPGGTASPSMGDDGGSWAFRAPRKKP
jgi:hypothetical protein